MAEPEIEVTTRRIGLFGGTFDPPHVGHLATAVNVASWLELDEMLMVVANEPWQKVGTRPITTAAVRLEMVQAAVSDIAGLAASDMELQRGGETYTADTLEQLHHGNPDVELFLVVGSDAAAGLDTWKRPEVVRQLATIVVVDRPGRRTGRPPLGWNWVNVEVPQLEVSSSDLRWRRKNNRPIDALVPPAVAKIVRDNRLFLEVESQRQYE